MLPIGRFNREREPLLVEPQLPLFKEDVTPTASRPGRDVQWSRSNGLANRIEESDRPFHDWYRFVLSFPPHLVRQYMERFDLKAGQRILDPFCGTGTTLVEAKLNSLGAVGMETNPIAHFASVTKTDWSANARRLRTEASRIATRAEEAISRARKLRTLPEERMKLLLTGSICPVPLHKSLLLLETIDQDCSRSFLAYARLAFAKTLVDSASNLHFGPEVGVRGSKEDADVVGAWLGNMLSMGSDLEVTRGRLAPKAIVYRTDSRAPGGLEPRSIDAVFTSPPYPNEKDYTRTTRLELITLGLISNKNELRELKKGLLRSNTRGVYKGDNDDTWINGNRKIAEIANEIERRRIELGKNSGFERLYSRVTKLYFGGMARHFEALRHYLRKGARLAYVVGDQASYLQVMIKTGELLAEIAESLGYIVEGIDLFRTRIATATRVQMREEIVLLQWPGTSVRP